MAGTPLGFLLSLIGLFTDSRKGFALFGLIVSGLLLASFMILQLC
jgi:hypothetical protein